MTLQNIREERVLVTGATGWFGRTATILAHSLGAELMCISTDGRKFIIENITFQSSKWDIESIKRFRPTIIIDCAFLTRDKLSTIPAAHYQFQNELLIAQSMQLQSLTSVRKFIGFSSGAARDLSPENLYGALKRDYEKNLTIGAKRPGVSTTLLRVWSVSGRHVTRPLDYLFSNLILQSRSGQININSKSKVYRRYCDLQDLILGALIFDQGGSHIIDSGGPLVEIEELATKIMSVMDRPCTVFRELTSTEDDFYASNNHDWLDFLQITGIREKSLSYQIQATDLFL